MNETDNKDRKFPIGIKSTNDFLHHEFKSYSLD